MVCINSDLGSWESNVQYWGQLGCFLIQIGGVYALCSQDNQNMLENSHEYPLKLGVLKGVVFMAFAVVAYLYSGCRIHTFVTPAPRQAVTVQDKRFTAAIHYAILLWNSLYDSINQLSLSQGAQQNRKPFKLDLSIGRRSACAFTISYATAYGHFQMLIISWISTFLD